MQTLAVAAISARALAESAAEEGFEVVALDLFGDLDTRRAASGWLPIGEPGSLRIDGARLLAALRTLAEARAQGAPVAGWIAGSGFEGVPELLGQAAAVLPFVGTAPDAVRRVRDPACFFDFLAAQRIGHPAIRFEWPEDPAGWLLKDAHGCGGWHVRRAASAARTAAVPPHHYFQREAAGQPMSATFIANGRDAQVLGFNRLEVRSVGDRPFVFGGVTGPVPMAEAMAHRLEAIVRALAREFALRGLCSLDFLRDDDAIEVLEVNPRPPASLSLYRDAGIVRAHLRACLEGVLPPPAPVMPQAAQGLEIVYARRALQLDEAAAARLAAWPGLHDLPGAGQCFDVGEPLCTLSARGISAGAVRVRLADGRERLLRSLERP